MENHDKAHDDDDDCVVDFFQCQWKKSRRHCQISDVLDTHLQLLLVGVSTYVPTKYIFSKFNYLIKLLLSTFLIQISMKAMCIIMIYFKVVLNGKSDVCKLGIIADDRMRCAEMRIEIIQVSQQTYFCSG